MKEVCFIVLALKGQLEGKHTAGGSVQGARFVATYSLERSALIWVNLYRN
jgi:hypothetical protein